MRGFAVAGLALIALYAVLQPGGAKAAETGGNALAQMAQRAISPEVAGVPQRGNFGAPAGPKAVGKVGGSPAPSTGRGDPQQSKPR